MSKLLEQVLKVNTYLHPIQFCLVTIINILNIRVLCSRILRSSPCTHYFLAYALFSIIYNCVSCSTQFLHSFYIDWAKKSQSRLLHTISTIRTARISIVIDRILSAIYMLPMLAIYKWDDISKQCLQPSNTLFYLCILSQIISYYILIFILMIIFDFLTMLHIRPQSIRTKRLISSIHRRRTEEKLARMLIFQV
ncbi:unnamed protein product [Rotaria sp. Silwood1]|nr:unnamed protein product [Rotaria sp. Silwood1]CAF4971469.1 unnamed protein product [Rotaria sp. Silwood1]